MRRRLAIGTPTIRDLPLPQLRARLSDLAHWGRFDGRKKKMVDVRPDPDAVSYAASLRRWPGNNVSIAGDMPRRCVFARLESLLENPEQRTVDTYKHPERAGSDRFKAWVREHRSDLVVKALTLLRAYIVAGMPDQQIGVMESFGNWAHLVCGAIVWAGGSNVLLTRPELPEPGRAVLVARLFVRGRGGEVVPRLGDEPGHLRGPGTVITLARAARSGRAQTRQVDSSGMAHRTGPARATFEPARTVRASFEPPCHLQVNETRPAKQDAEPAPADGT
jgi:hypothetical protein